MVGEETWSVGDDGGLSPPTSPSSSIPIRLESSSFKVSAPVVPLPGICSSIFLSFRLAMEFHVRLHRHRSFLLLPILLFVFSSGTLKVDAFTGTYGINYGRIADNLPAPESVVTLLKANRIKNVRIYDADHDVLKAFSKSGLEIVVGLGNQYLKEMSVNEDSAMTWIKENVQAFLPDTHIVGIAVGNEILGGSDAELAEVLLPAVKNVYNAISRLQLTGTIQVWTPHSEAVFASSFPPSSCRFRDDVIQYMTPLLAFFSKTGAPFYVNAYPFLAYMSDPSNININYALLKPNAGVYDKKSNLRYDNMFDAQIDAAYAALEAAGYGDMEVRISETGWASKGDANEAGATIEDAKTYNFNMRRRLAKRKGTPYRPKRVVKAYIFALFNEDLKPGPTSERNFGLFKPDGSIAYDIGFTGLKPSSASSSFAISEGTSFFVGQLGSLGSSFCWNSSTMQTIDLAALLIFTTLLLFLNAIIIVS